MEVLSIRYAFDDGTVVTIDTERGVYSLRQPDYSGVWEGDWDKLLDEGIDRLHEGSVTRPYMEVILGQEGR